MISVGRLKERAEFKLLTEKISQTVWGNVSMKTRKVGKTKFVQLISEKTFSKREIRKGPEDIETNRETSENECLEMLK